MQTERSVTVHVIIQASKNQDSYKVNIIYSWYMLTMTGDLGLGIHEANKVL